ncbi:MAG: hypothetical protein J0L82_11260 [Deltaproteobacteria bacterium]|jgi:hypothetical protein|nr:hypothetical protein [Deltaproteobacteria bacterium]
MNEKLGRSPTLRSLPLTSLFVILATLLVSANALAWGRIGHDLSARVAAHLVAETTGKPFYKSRAMDLGYYCNVPDLVWKKTSYQVEWTNHFMDLEIFQREFTKRMEEGKLTPKEDPYDLPRAAFNTKFPTIPDTAGRAYWRIRELEKRLGATADLLKQKDILKEERHRLQLEWLIVAGTLGHYVTDLSQPLHVTENYDGQMTEQKGIHAHFEDTLVDELWPSIDMQVYKEADRIWEKDRAAMTGKTSLALLKELAESSAKDLDEILKRDKKTPRDDLKKAVEIYRPVIVRRLAAGAVVLAEIWRRHSNWAPNEDKFYSFAGEPAFIEPPVPPPTPTPKPSPKP